MRFDLPATSARQACAADSERITPEKHADEGDSRIPMSNSAKTIIGVIVVVVIVLIGWAVMHRSSSTNSEYNSPEATTTNETQTTQTQTNGTSANTSDTSDAALNKDSAAVDAEMTGLNSDNASADQGLSQTQ